MKKQMKYMENLIRMDIRNQFRNKAVMIVIIIPFLFGGLMTYLYNGVEAADTTLDIVYGNFAFYMSCLMMICIMGGESLPAMIVEEKENRTLRTLRQSGVRDRSFLLSKVMVCLLVTETGCLLLAIMTGMSPVYLPQLFLVTGLALLVFIFLGISISILSLTQTEVGVYSAPLMLFFMIPPMLGEMSELLDRIARYTPLDAMMKAFWGMVGTPLYNMHTGVTQIPDPWFHIAVLLVWIVGSGMLCCALYKKKGL